MISFVKCPFCSGHEAISLEAAQYIATLLKDVAWATDFAVAVELSNIRNTILNHAQREEDIDPLLT
jgi:hypothetical protein